MSNHKEWLDKFIVGQDWLLFLTERIEIQTLSPVYRYRHHHHHHRQQQQPETQQCYLHRHHHQCGIIAFIITDIIRTSSSASSSSSSSPQWPRYNKSFSSVFVLLPDCFLLFVNVINFNWNVVLQKASWGHNRSTEIEREREGAISAEMEIVYYYFYYCCQSYDEKHTHTHQRIPIHSHTSFDTVCTYTEAHTNNFQIS